MKQPIFAYATAAAVLSSSPAHADVTDFIAPPLISIAEARSSDACDATEFATRVAELKKADPEAAAEKAAVEGEFKFLEFDGIFGPPEPTQFPQVKSSIACDLPIARTQDNPDYKLYRDAIEVTYRQAIDILSNNHDDSKSIAARLASGPHCSSVIQVLAADYANRYNETLLAHTRNPNRDLCRHIVREPTPPAAASPSIDEAPFQRNTWNWGFTPEDPVAVYWRTARLTSQVRASAERRPAANLAQSARFGDDDALKRFVESGASLQERDDFGVSATDWAVIKDNAVALEVLMAAPRFIPADACDGLEKALVYDRHDVFEKLARKCFTGPPSDLMRINLRNAIVNKVARDGNVEDMQLLVTLGAPLDNAILNGIGPPILIPSDYKEYHPFVSAEPRSHASGHINADAATNAAVGVNWPMLDYIISVWPPEKKQRLGDLMHLAANQRYRETEQYALPPFHKHTRAVNTEILLRKKLSVNPNEPMFSFQSLSEKEALPLLMTFNSADGVRTAVKFGIGINGHSIEGFPAVLAAVLFCSDDMLRTVLELGADVNAIDSVTTAEDADRQHSPFGIKQTALMHLIFGAPQSQAWSREPHIIVDSADNTKPDPKVYDWLRSGGAQMADILIRNGARLDATDTMDMTALHYAAHFEQADEIAKRLLYAGASVNLRDKSGHTPLDYAREAGLAKMQRVLTDFGALPAGDVPPSQK